MTFILDPASAEAGYRVRAAYVDHDNPGEGEGETLHADLGNVEFLRISGLRRLRPAGPCRRLTRSC